MNEAETRAEHIDPALAAAGWGVFDGSRVRPQDPIAPGWLEGYCRRVKLLSAGYLLEYRNPKLAIVEAKAFDEAITEGMAKTKHHQRRSANRTKPATLPESSIASGRSPICTIRSWDELGSKPERPGDKLGRLGFIGMRCRGVLPIATMMGSNGVSSSAGPANCSLLFP